VGRQKACLRASHRSIGLRCRQSRFLVCDDDSGKRFLRIRITLVGGPVPIDHPFICTLQIGVGWMGTCRCVAGVFGFVAVLLFIVLGIFLGIRGPGRRQVEVTAGAGRPERVEDNAKSERSSHHRPPKVTKIRHAVVSLYIIPTF
jgi:hypothetical protein